MITRNDFIELLPENYTTTEHAGATVYFYTKNNKPYILAFIGKRNKPDANYYFDSDKKRGEYVYKYFKRLQARKEAKEKRRMEKLKPTTLKVGDILYTSWGYDQTNVDFFQVVVVVGKRTVDIKEIAMEKLDYQSHGMACQVKPIKGTFIKDAKVMRKRVTNDTIKINQSATAWKWDKETTYCSWYA